MQDTEAVTPRIRYCADWGLLAEFGSSIDPDLNSWTRLVAQRLQKNSLPGVLEIVPAYASFLVIYDPLELDTKTLERAILSCCRQFAVAEAGKRARVVDIPVCYEGELAPDLENVAGRNGLDVRQVIRIHTGTDYLVYMLGFAPGFPYLGGLDERLHTPRLDTPRELVPAGSVGIAGSQTGIYPLSSPGGWQIIGRTPLRLFDPGLENPVPYYAPGDRLRFYEISREEFHRLEQIEYG